MTEDEMVGWHHQLNGHESEPTLGDSGGQGSLVCCSPWDCKELDKAWQLSNSKTQHRADFQEDNTCMVLGDLIKETA